MMKIACDGDRCEGATVVSLTGILDALGATDLADRASPCITAERPSLIVDMTEVTRLTSAGITTLIQLLQRARPLGGKVSLYGCTGPIRRVLRVVSLEEMLNLCDTIEEARARLA